MSTKKGQMNVLRSVEGDLVTRVGMQILEYGFFMDVYLAARRTKRGTIFGFVRFFNVNDIVSLEQKLKGKARNIHAPCNISTLFKQEGIGGDVIHYIGGLSFLCEWGSEKLAVETLESNKVNLSSWFLNLDIWKEDMEPTGDKFGTILEIDNMDVNGTIKNSMDVLVLTNKMDEISKCVTIKFNERLCPIRVMEDHNLSFLLNLPTEYEYVASDDGSLNGDEDSDGISNTDLGRTEEEKIFSDDPWEDECEMMSGDSPYVVYHVPKKVVAKFFNHWMEDDDFNNIVKTSWDVGVYQGSANIVLKNKLKKLKSDVKVWWNINHKRTTVGGMKFNLSLWIETLKLNLDHFLHITATNGMNISWTFIFYQKKRQSLKQKSRVKWAIKGDENTKIFHSIID
ncbi:hypothetical protein Tco_1150263 [Tanacetum coccineum]